jgi:trigger factor
MNYTTKKQDGGRMLFTITVTPNEYEADLKKAASRIANKTTIKGFRKGTAPFDIVKRDIGEMAILQEALQGIVSSTVVEAIEAEHIDTVGAPEITIEKMAPGNDLVFTAMIALLPEVTLPDIKKIKVTKKEATIDESKFQETLDALRGMHAEEKEKDGPATGTDKLLLDMNMSIDGVPVDGGQAKDHQVYLSENHYIPGFNEQVAGLRTGEQKSFTLDFPEEHYQKHLAGKKVDVDVTVTQVFERILPEITDEFAKKLGQESAAELTSIIKKNMESEAEQKAHQSFEIELLDTLIEKSKFTDIPQILIDSEKQKIFYELTRDLERHGITTEQYLADLKKTESELLEDFSEQAEKRAKAALISRTLAKQEALVATEEEIEKEIEQLRAMYSTNEETLQALERTEVRDTIAVQIQNRKVMEWLQEQVAGASKSTKKKDSSKRKEKKKEEAHVHGPDCDH